MVEVAKNTSSQRDLSDEASAELPEHYLDSQVATTD